MEIIATAKFTHISPKKVQPWLKSLRRQPASIVLDTLRYTNTKAGKIIYKLITSAVNSAVNNYNFKPDNLRIKLLTVDEGPRYKRYWFRSHGSADVKLKRMAHLKVVLEEIIEHSVAATKSSKKASSSKPTHKALPATAQTKTSASQSTRSTKDKHNLARAKKPTTKTIFSRTTNK